MLLRGRCTRYFQLIINVLYIKRGKSAPPYKNFHEKNTLVIQTSQNLPLHFLELNAKHVHGGQQRFEKKNFHITLQLVTRSAASDCYSFGYSGDSF